MKKISRRYVLGGASGSLLSAARPATAGLSANSAVTVGIIGTGGRGRLVGQIFAADPRARVTAICDLFDDQLERAKTQIPGAAQARVYKNYAELLAQPSLDAILIATPAFLHPEHFEAAVKAGKHIYCEKPAGVDAAGVKRMLRASRQADPSKHVVIGFQQRFSPEYLAAEQLVRSGRLGDIVFMEAHFVRSGARITPFQSAYPPAEQRIRHHGVNRETSGDIIVEQDCHGLDILNWFAGAHPVKAIGSGGRIKRRFGDNLDHLAVVYEYPGGLKGVLVATQLTPERYRDVREQFIGTRGVLETTRNYYKWDRGEGAIATVQSKREITIDAVEDFLTHVVDQRPQNNAITACDSTLTGILGRLAIDSRREISWEEMLREN